MAGGYACEDTFTEDVTQKTEPAKILPDSPCGKALKQKQAAEVAATEEV